MAGCKADLVVRLHTVLLEEGQDVQDFVSSSILILLKAKMTYDVQSADITEC